MSSKHRLGPCTNALTMSCSHVMSTPTVYIVTNAIITSMDMSIAHTAHGKLLACGAIQVGW